MSASRRSHEISTPFVGVTRHQPWRPVDGDPSTTRSAYAGPPEGGVHRVQTQQRTAFFGPVADQRQRRDQFVVVFDGAGTGEKEPPPGGVGLAERDGTEVVQPVEDLSDCPIRGRDA